MIISAHIPNKNKANFIDFLALCVSTACVCSWMNEQNNQFLHIWVKSMTFGRFGIPFFDMIPISVFIVFPMLCFFCETFSVEIWFWVEFFYFQLTIFWWIYICRVFSNVVSPLLCLKQHPKCFNQFLIALYFFLSFNFRYNPRAFSHGHIHSVVYGRSYTPM